MGLWTLTHFYAIIPAFIVFALVAILTRRLLRNKSDKMKMLPLRIIAVAILLLEVGKQGISLSQGYDLYYLPFHYCSLFLYLLPLHAFSWGKVRRFADAMAFATASSLFLFFLIMPTVVYSEGAITNFAGSYFDFHTLVFHHLVILYLFIAVANGMFTLSLSRDFKLIAVALSAYVIIATVLSYALEVNFHNLRTCNLGIVEQIRVALNEAIGPVGQALYVIALFALTTLFAYLAYYLVWLVYRRAHRRRA